MLAHASKAHLDTAASGITRAEARGVVARASRPCGSAPAHTGGTPVPLRPRHCPVAQICNLLYRRLSVGRAPHGSTPCGLQIRDAADCKSALQTMRLRIWGQYHDGLTCKKRGDRIAAGRFPSARRLQWRAAEPRVTVRPADTPFRHPGRRPHEIPSRSWHPCLLSGHWRASFGVDHARSLAHYYRIQKVECRRQHATLLDRRG